MQYVTTIASHVLSLLQHFTTAIFFLLGIFARTITPPIIDWLQLQLAQLAAKRRWHIAFRSRLGGNWHHAWYAKGSTTWPDENLCFVSLCAVGRHAAGIYVYREQAWLVTASVDKDHIVTGVWRELSTGGYRGTWLGKADLNHFTITGWYLGTSERSPTGVGEWIWWREGKTRPPLPTPLVQPAPRLLTPTTNEIKEEP